MWTVDRFGRAARPAPPVPNTSGVSSIHSAVACVDAYGTVVVNDLPVDRFWSVIVQTLPLGTTSWMSTWIWSPAATGSDVMVRLGAGISSNHAE